RDLTQGEIKEKLSAFGGSLPAGRRGAGGGKNTIPYVIRFKAPLDGETIIEDLIHGAVKFKNSLIDDYVLLKSDGFPTYHLASVVDDYLMEITHIIRGEEWLPSAGLHKLLYQAFGWETPYFAHLPIILAPGGGKLSKRQGDVAVIDYINKGYLPEALVNFILFLGWNPGDEREFFNLEEMIKEFTLDKIGKSGAIFDLKKLEWMNGWYIRKMELGRLTELCVPYLIKAGMIEEIHPVMRPGAPSDDGAKFKVVKTGEEVNFDWLKKVIALEQERMKKLSDVVEATKYFFVDVPEYDALLLKWKKITPEQIKSNLEEIIKILERLETKFPSKSDWEIALKPLTEKLGVGETLWPLRVALSGVKASPSPFEIAEVLGKEKVLKRLKAAIRKVGQ
ncbi:glutamate--tRNA ligase, partial [Patescibacteria group bacterium]|nr:glutamate--tRNA ligase [Patescibacteria group bacterium]